MNSTNSQTSSNQIPGTEWIRGVLWIKTPKSYRRLEGTVHCLNYDFQKHQYLEFDYPYYLSDKGRLCFNASPALFNGMSPERLGQYEDQGRYAHMVTNGYFYAEHKCLFFKNVVRRYQHLFSKNSSGIYSVSLTAKEMDADNVVVSVDKFHPALHDWLR